MKLTRWQILIGDEWRSFDARVVVELLCGKFDRPGAVRLATVEVPRSVRFKRLPRTVEIRTFGLTPRRLAAAKRAIDRAIGKAGIFADQEAARQPSPEERVNRSDQNAVEQEKFWRARRAAEWRDVRRSMRTLTQTERADVLEEWSRGVYPCEPSWLLLIIKRRCELVAQIEEAA